MSLTRSLLDCCRCRNRPLVVVVAILLLDLAGTIGELLESGAAFGAEAASLLLIVRARAGVGRRARIYIYAHIHGYISV